MNREKEILGASEETDEMKDGLENKADEKESIDADSAVSRSGGSAEHQDDSKQAKQSNVEELPLQADISKEHPDQSPDIAEPTKDETTQSAEEHSSAVNPLATQEKTPGDAAAETSPIEQKEEKKDTDALVGSQGDRGEEKHQEGDNNDEEHDDHEDDHHKVDYHNYDKKQLVAVIEGLLKETNFRKIDDVLKEIKPHYDELREAERAEALHKFIETGGDAADFVLRPDPLDTRFEADFALLRDRRSKHYSNLEKQKEANLAAKNALLEKLRSLVDDEETTASINALKEIQNEWKKIGQIPAGQVKTLWANYNALIDRYYDNRSIYFELKELDRRKNLELKLEICEKAEKLAEETNIKNAIKSLNELHEEFRHIGPVPKEEQEALWQRFKKASDVLYDKRREFVDKLKVDLNANLKIKQVLGDEAQAFLAFDSERINEWNEKTREILELQKKWEAAGGLPREKAKEINKHFWGAFKGFFANKNAFFKRLESQRDENLKKKEALIAKAESLKESTDWESTAESLKQLQNEWKAIGPVPEKQRNAIFSKFKKACDYFFEHKRAKNKEVNKEFEENLEKKEAICASIEKLTAEKDFDINKLETYFDEYQAIGFVPKNAIKTIQNRFNESVDNFLDAAENLSDEEKHNIKLTIKFTKLKNSPNANRKLYHKEGEIRKHIHQLENDIALWKNNLEFFANSRTADKLKQEFDVKIEKAKDELKELQDQLHVLRNI